MPPTEVFVTGIGIVSPAGLSADETLRALLAGITAIRPLTGPELPGDQPWLGGRVPLDHLTVDPDRASVYAAMAANEALRRAKWDGPVPAISLGASKPDIRLLDCLSGPHNACGCVPGFSVFPSGIALSEGCICHMTAPACASGTLAFIQAVQLIEDRRVSAMLCVGADASIESLWLASYHRLGVLAEPHPKRGPGYACRPFDRTRCGFAVGEGAGAVFLESAESVRARNALPMARVSGYARGTDPSGLTQLDPTGEPLAHVISTCLDRAACRPKDIAAVFAHGTATTTNDPAEIAALRLAIGTHVARTPVVSMKGPLGHLLGAAGAVEIALAVKARNTCKSPGNITLTEPDAELGDCCLPTGAFTLQDGAVLKTSLGFGGHVAAILLA